MGVKGFDRDLTWSEQAEFWKLVKLSELK